MTKIEAESKFPGLIAVIGDEDTVTGFLLAGVGNRDKKGKTNFLVVDPEKTKHEEIANAFKTFTGRKDISIIMVTQSIATEIRYLLKDYNQTIPTVLEIPSKNIPYDETKDSILQRVKKMLGKD